MTHGCLHSILMPPPSSLRSSASTPPPPPPLSAAQVSPPPPPPPPLTFIPPPLYLLAAQIFSASSPDELRLLLASASLELATMRAEEKAHETRLWRLQTLLDTIRQERDDAREECRKLQERLFHLLLPPPPPSPPPPPAASPPWSSAAFDDVLRQQPLDGGFPDDQKLPLLSSCHDSSDFEALFFSCNSAAAADSKSADTAAADADNDPFDVLDDLLPAFDLPLLQPPPPPPGADSSSASAENSGGGGGGGALLPEEMSFAPNSAPFASPSSTPRSLSRQSSSNSTAASAASHSLTFASDAPDEPFFAATMASFINNEQSGEVMSSSSNCSSITPLPAAAAAAAPQSSATSAVEVPEIPGFCVIAPEIAASAAQINAEWPTTFMAAQSPSPPPAAPPPSAANSSAASPSPAQQRKPRMVHLPEPPESDPQVVLNSLPERGKLLQAVMQAGPLLQTLLLAGPLPKWRHPPPTLATADIPRVSLVAFSVPPPPQPLTSCARPAAEPASQSHRSKHPRLDPSAVSAI